VWLIKFVDNANMRREVTVSRFLNGYTRVYMNISR